MTHAGPAIAALLGLGIAWSLSRASSRARAPSSPSSPSSPDLEPGPTPTPGAPPSVVTVPLGWQRMADARVTDALRAFALDVLHSAARLGELVTLRVGDRDVGALVEWHWDAARGWHRGVSLLERARA